jgi:hypothetical protein
LITSAGGFSPSGFEPLPRLQEKGKFVAPIDSAAFAVADVSILRTGVYHFDGFLNCLYCRIAAEYDTAV